jgi:multidrug efflux pump subunit AcrA (membrane-fusion protein)
MSVLKKIMKIKKIIGSIIFAVLIIEGIIFVSIQMQNQSNQQNDSQSAQVKAIDSTVVADGVVTAQDQATLHFQTGGKLVSVPLKEGDKVYQGQTIAQLDTYPLQRQLTIALNTYKATRDKFDQNQQDQGNTVSTNEQQAALQTAGAGSAQQLDQGYGNSTTATDYINQVVQRIADESQTGLDTSVANVEIANYALQMATLTSPLTGIVTQEDVDVAGQNVTPTTSFVVADPSTKIFRANVPASDIYYITEGMNASVMLDGSQNKINGTIVKIYPSKVTLATGESVYQVDIQSDQITSSSKLDQGGTAIIMTNAENLTLVPAWTVLSGKYVWVQNNGKLILRSVTTGKVHGEQMEITGGLDSQDRVITDPEMIPSKKYPLL